LPSLAVPKKMAKIHEKKVRPITFREGGLVLRKVLVLSNEDHGKWAPNYEGLYIVKKIFRRSFDPNVNPKSKIDNLG